MVIRRVAPFSLGKLLGALYLLLGLLIGCIVAMVSAIGSSLVPADQLPIPYAGVIFGVGAVVAFPLLYGFFGFLGGLLMAALYNVAAGWTGGIELETR